MGISDKLNRRIRARPEEDEDGYLEVSGSEEASGDEISDESGPFDDEDYLSDENNENSEDELADLSNDDSDDIQQDDEEEDEDDSDLEEEHGEEDIQASLSNISFGALAKAQASLGPKSKHASSKASKTEDTTATSSPLDDIRARIREAREQKRKDNPHSEKSTKPPSRSSKHAPTVQSSKHAVSRKRTVVELPNAVKARDPRFDPTVLSNSKRFNPDAANKAYSFLDDYRASELKEMKEKMAKTKDPNQKEALKRAIRSATDRMRSIENKKRERDVMMEHKKREKQLIREGKKSQPYFLKKSDLKKQVLVKKYEEMGSKDRAKALERRRKKTAAKERKEMPMERRALAGDSAPFDNDGGSRKRRRMA